MRRFKLHPWRVLLWMMWLTSLMFMYVSIYHQGLMMNECTPCDKETYRDTEIKLAYAAAPKKPVNIKTFEVRDVANVVQQTLDDFQDGNCRLCSAHDRIRRKIHTTNTELWYYLRNQLTPLKKMSTELLPDAIDSILNDITGYHYIIQSDFLKLADGDEGWRLNASLTLGDLVQRRIGSIQNRKCERTLHCKFDLSCGYGCQLRHVVTCLMAGYASNRTVVLHSKGWNYEPRGWETMFKPLTLYCSPDDFQLSDMAYANGRNIVDDIPAMRLKIITSLGNDPRLLPLSAPDDLADDILSFHGDPAVWWIGQFTKYVTRQNDVLKSDLQKSKDSLGFMSPVVGIHVRRTDKVGTEASFHDLDEYMVHVKEWFNILDRRQPSSVRRVFIATDDPSVISEARDRYPEFIFIHDENTSQHANVRERNKHLFGIIRDIELLSQSDFLVCTFSSRVCRSAYDLMLTIHGDASSRFRSLDDIYFYGGQEKHIVVAIAEHKAKTAEEMDMSPGDKIHDLGNHWDGYSLGVNTRTKKTGLFPSYKVVDTLRRVRLPTYPQIQMIRDADIWD